jgi:RNA polymerase sigma-70 factor (ECF subfamily)
MKSVSISLRREPPKVAALDVGPAPDETATIPSDSPPSPALDEEFSSGCVEHIDQVWRQLRAMGVAERHLDDATQEVFLTAHQKYSSFEGRAKLGTWFYAIAYRVGCNYRRKAQRDPPTAADESERPGISPDPEQTLATKQTAAFVQKFCDSLSEKLRDVFVLCLLEDRSAGEVAELLDVPENTVYSRIRLAREAFRKELAQWRELPQ